MYKKSVIHVKNSTLLIKPIAFVAFPLPWPSSDLKVPSVITGVLNIQHKPLGCKWEKDPLQTISKSAGQTLKNIAIPA